MSKKTIIIICSALLSVLLAVSGAFLVVHLAKKTNDSSSLSSSPYESVPEISTPAVVIPDFEIYSPTKTYINTTENFYTFSGKSNTNDPVTLNGEPVALTEDGIFSITVQLNEGKNTFTFVHKEKSYIYTINYRYVILKSYSPSSAASYNSGSTLAVSAIARKGSVVTASFNGETITLNQYIAQNETEQTSESFSDYIGSFVLPSTNKDVNLGKITFTATLNGKTESFSSGNITCKKAEIKVEFDPNAAPLGGRYINVGTGKITEIIAYEAETFDAYSTNDWSRPTNNYLPKGTVDYSAAGYVYYQSSTTKKEYAVLRCGKQVYTSKKNVPTNEIVPIVSEYAGTLPDHNEINISSFKTEGNHTVLTLDTLWKAPFYLDILPQNYTNPSKQDYTISEVTYQYIDITFCYATVLTGEITIPETNPLFSSATIIKNNFDYTIRLYLRKKGCFYGWDANYNANGQLVFEFLNPARVSTASNSYGANLSGVKILIDVGHGGTDPGAVGVGGATTCEADRNLTLANKIRAELQSIGATVYMTRTSNTTSSNDDKIKILKNLKPDLCIAIHHDASTSSSPNGFGAYYSQPFSKKATELVYSYTINTGIYSSSKFSWHYYYMARSSYCPVVLTENGFITNTYDFSHMINEDSLNRKAFAISKGIADYFLASSPNDVPLPVEPQTPPTQTPVTPQPPVTPTPPESNEEESKPSEPTESSKPSEPSEPSEPEDSSEPTEPEDSSTPPKDDSSDDQTSNDT